MQRPPLIPQPVFLHVQCNMDASSVITEHTEHTEHTEPVLGPEMWRKPLWAPFRGVSSSRFTRRHSKTDGAFRSNIAIPLEREISFHEVVPDSSIRQPSNDVKRAFKRLWRPCLRACSADIPPPRRSRCLIESLATLRHRSIAFSMLLVCLPHRPSWGGRISY
ncbi:hypothetical protein CH63R_02461 [Colletotrichum higginsianum IMI 349063]|uniref:Uncharacterized protein n=1 Tax=Colletotrichum higginsianum (strain IMI 349063) TaxID=759273 RepID=A0A1B7YNU6_COLHI|nr:hypothetical protein CH63R_02461 [Colletotrichum higginsianum IMI 349063]OBR13735.1 hypothetical protein CH63R_02461 [Colletotrichum higginsianum IMI 349063]